MLVVGVVLLAGCAVEGGEGSGQGGDVSARTLEQSTPVGEGGVANPVGSSDDSGGFVFTVHQVVDPWVPVSEWAAPPAGMRLVAVEVTVANQGGGVEVWSSALGAEVADTESRVWQTGFAAPDPGMAGVDGDVQPGGERRGWFSFEVPADAQLVELRLRGNLTAAGAVWAIGG